MRVYAIFRADGLTQLDRLIEQAEKLRIGAADHQMREFCSNVKHVMMRVLEHDADYYMLGLPEHLRQPDVAPVPATDPRDRRRVK